MKCKAVLCGVQDGRNERILRSCPYQAIAQSEMIELGASSPPVVLTERFPHNSAVSFQRNRLSTADPGCGKIEALWYRCDEWCWLVQILCTGKHRETGSQEVTKTGSQYGMS